ncbi:hypothetical protein [Salipiger mucosus]|uniref:hypothetical protein n=1 Tax=Salipiger mucosus TaxID=263378 RepID=UPI00037F5763|nr:hypothetical protein [Salipiger mucosus]
MTGTVLILGGSGRFGSNAAEAFWNAGWRVRLFDRASGDLDAEAEGADVIVNGWNPAYPDWARDLPGQTRRLIEVARRSGATVLIPGNLYVYGAGSPEVLGVATPHRAENPLGRLRREMEETWRASGCRVILLRAGDFLDTRASGNWFDRMMAPKLPRGALTYPGNPDVPHAWAFLPDLARAAVALAERRVELPAFAEIPFPGITLTGREMAATLTSVMGREVRVRRMHWWPLRLAAPVWPMARHLLEMRYLWDMPHRIDPAPFETLLPGFASTPPEDALRVATAHLRAGTGSPRPAGARAVGRPA